MVHVDDVLHALLLSNFALSDALDFLLLSCIIRAAPFADLKRFFNVNVVGEGKGIEVSSDDDGAADGGDADSGGVAAERRARRGRCRRPRSGGTAASDGQNSSVTAAMSAVIREAST